MNYELALKLKEAGFPQKEPLIYEPYKVENISFVASTISTGVYYPTLSELIEACGDRFKWLGRYPAYPYGYSNDDYFNKVKWVCGEWEGHIPSEGEYFTDLASGHTPEEAVARLWIELNKK